MSMMPHACIGDYISWSFYEDNGRKCLFNRQATLITPVSEFLDLYAADTKSRYSHSASSDKFGFAFDRTLLSCVESGTLGSDGSPTYTKIGCSSKASHLLALNEYSDSSCGDFSLIKSIELGSSKSATKASSSEFVTFGSCRSCLDPKDSSSDICQNLWSVSSYCSKSCQARGFKAVRWTSPTIFAVVIEVIFFFVFAICIGEGLQAQQRRREASDLLSSTSIERNTSGKKASGNKATEKW